MNIHTCPTCHEEIVPQAIPDDDNGNERLLCPHCGGWKWCEPEETS